jgi:hypothetical protein
MQHAAGCLPHRIPGSRITRGADRCLPGLNFRSSRLLVVVAMMVMVVVSVDDYNHLRLRRIG